MSIASAPVAGTSLSDGRSDFVTKGKPPPKRTAVALPDRKLTAEPR